jgi:hypothetical protein
VRASGTEASHSLTVTISGSIARNVGNVRVEIVAEPPTAQTDHMHPGQVMPMTRVTSSTSADGRFALGLSRPALRRFANPDGAVNMQAWVRSGRKVGFYAFSVNLSKPAPVRIGAIRMQAAPDYCTETVLVAIYKPHPTSVGATAAVIKSPGLGQQFTYTANASSSLGVGLLDPSGTWSAGGTYNISSTSGIPFANYGGDQAYVYKTDYQYAEYTNGCTTWTAPYEYAGGAQADATTAPYAAHCLRYAAGTSPFFNNQTAYTFTAAINISEIGFSAQGTTGWSNEAAITYKMGTYSHDICGTANYPGSTPKKIVIGLP